MFTQGLSRELGSRGITVNNIQPGPIDTDLNPAAGDGQRLRRAPQRSIAMGVLMRSPRWSPFVAGPESSYITGANLTVDAEWNA